MTKKLLVSVIDFYQTFFSFDRGLLAFLAPGGACRYPLSCSEYTKQAIRQEGALKGIFLGLKRIGSCR